MRGISLLLLAAFPIISISLESLVKKQNKLFGEKRITHFELTPSLPTYKKIVFMI